MQQGGAAGGSAGQAPAVVPKKQLERLEGLALHLDVFCLAVLEPGQTPKLGEKKEKQDVLQALANVLEGTNTDRECEITYHDTFFGDWCDLKSTTTKAELGSCAKFRLQFKDPIVDAPFQFLHGPLYNVRVGLKNQLSKDFKLRTPQYEAILAMRARFTHASSTNGGNFMVILPTGVGKSIVIAYAPFIVEAKKVLIVLPSLELLKQLKDDLSEKYSPIHDIGRLALPKNGSYYAEPFQFDKAEDKLPKAKHRVITANIQQLASKDGVTDGAQSLLDMLVKVDLVIVDEGHHSAADSWKILRLAAQKANPQCKFVFLTATPQRGDGRFYGLDNAIAGCQEFFIYNRKKALALDMIKKTHYFPQDITDLQFTKLTSIKGGFGEQNQPEYIKRILRPAVAQLKALRGAIPKIGGDVVPIRMLVTVHINEDAKRVATQINKTWYIYLYACISMTWTTDFIMSILMNRHAERI